MAICNTCTKDMSYDNTNSCIEDTIVIKEKEFKQIPYGKETRFDGSAFWPPTGSDRCHDCNVTVGGFHHPGCDMEQCPKCNGQLLSCGCLDDEEDISK